MMKLKKSPRFSSPTAASSSKVKKVSREEVAELQASVRKLSHQSGRLSAAASESMATVETIAPQVETLRRAYAKLSEVFVEEVDTLRSENRTLRGQLSARGKEIDELASLSEKMTRELHSVKAEMAALRSENAELQEMFATRSSVAGLSEDFSSMRAEVADLRERVFGIASLSSSVDTNAASIREALRESQETRNRTASVAEAVSHVTSELASQREGLARVKSELSTASSALAQDVSMLAERLGALDTRFSREADATSSRLREVTEAVESRSSSDRAATESRVASLERQAAAQHEQTRQSLLTLQRQQERMRSAVEEGLQAASSEVKAGLSRSSALESGLVARIADVRRQVLDQADETQRQFQAVSHAIHAFADVLNVSAPMPSFR